MSRGVSLQEVLLREAHVVACVFRVRASGASGQVAPGVANRDAPQGRDDIVRGVEMLGHGKYERLGTCDAWNTRIKNPVRVMLFYKCDGGS